MGDDVSLICLINGVLIFICFGPLCVFTISYGFAWADEVRSEEVKNQAVLVFRCAAVALALNIALPLVIAMNYKGDAFVDMTYSDVDYGRLRAEEREQDFTDEESEPTVVGRR